MSRNRRLMEDIVSPITTLRSIGCQRNEERKSASYGNIKNLSNLLKREPPENQMSPALPITQEPSRTLAKAGSVLRTLILCQASHLLRDRKYHQRQYRRCMIGTEMVDWLLHQQPVRVLSRGKAVGMWQALLEEGVISHVTSEHQFKDKYLFYRFKEDMQAEGNPSTPTQDERAQAESDLSETLECLLRLAPDATFRMILRKPLGERTAEDLEIIYEELPHIKALSHLSSNVKRELAAVLTFESHPVSGTIVFNQGEEGNSWYIILKGSVDVVIYGKGAVCSLHEGDDFGKLAVVNGAPRAATIRTRENNCHFLLVEKEDFNNIIRDVEANTVRLKEHGQNVLLLQKIPLHENTIDGTHSHDKYMIMAGTPQKMLEHLLETRIDIDHKNIDSSDTFLEDFLLTHIIFMPNHQLCPELMRHYRIELTNCSQDIEFIAANKKRVLRFVRIWASFIRDAFLEDKSVGDFLKELWEAVQNDSHKYGIGDDFITISKLNEAKQRYDYMRKYGPRQKWEFDPNGRMHPMKKELLREDQIGQLIQGHHDFVFRVYRGVNTSVTIETRVEATAETIKKAAADKIPTERTLVLFEMKSTGEKVIFKDTEVSVPTGLSVNGRIFVAFPDGIETLIPDALQHGPSEGTSMVLENFNSMDIAYNMTLYEWELFMCVHEYELIYQVFGRHQFRKPMSNLDLFLRRFNEVQYWVVTEMVLATNLSRRVQLLRKFIKIAAHCMEYQNMNSFFAIVMGLGNVAVSRLMQTWDRLPSRLKRTYQEFETMIDPSRNHRSYRLFVAKMVPPIIPFMPLLLKDMTFAHEGNKTYMDGLVNFEKMHMIAQTLRTIRYCRSQPMDLQTPPGNKPQDGISSYIRDLKVIDNQKRLGALSDALEPRRP